MNKQTFNLSTTVTEFSPLLGGIEPVFKGLKKTGIDGIELVIGLKSRWAPRFYKKLSAEYELPILSLHQPIWSGLDFAFDEGFIEFANIVDAKAITFHPLPRLSLSSDKMKRYFEKLSKIKERTKLDILVENMPGFHKKIYGKLIYPASFLPQISDLLGLIKTYQLAMTLDIDHLRVFSPHKESWFQDGIQYIHNIHLSSFTKKKTHLPLYLGDFDTRSFIRYLKEVNYTGQVNLELYYPSMFNVFSYNFEAVRRSVDIIREIK